jgi:hypothetical protein
VIVILSHCNNENGGADITGIPAASTVNRGVAKLFRSRVDFPPPLIHDRVQSTAHPSPCSPFRTCCKEDLPFHLTRNQTLFNHSAIHLEELALLHAFPRFSTLQSDLYPFSSLSVYLSVLNKMSLFTTLQCLSLLSSLFPTLMNNPSGKESI